jgi:hypothetical protein
MKVSRSKNLDWIWTIVGLTDLTERFLIATNQVPGWCSTDSEQSEGFGHVLSYSFSLFFLFLFFSYIFVIFYSLLFLTCI